MKILIIEDEYSLADAIAEALKKENFATTIITDGEEGENEALTNVYDLILLDIMLPNKDGFKILNDLRTEKIDTPIIILTAKSEINDKLNGLVAFASLAYDFGEENDKDYIPDTDTLLVYGKHLLVVDAKNLKTKPNQTLMLSQGSVIDADKGKELIEVHPSTHIWQRVMENAGISLESIDGYVCIVNDTEIEILRTDEWYESHTKLIHISELKGILEEWVEGKDNTLYLNMLTEISKAQIKKKKEISFDVDAIKRKFKI